MSNTKKLNVAFFGTPDMCIPFLETLKDSGYMPSLIVTNPDRKSGRGLQLTPPPVRVWGLENNIQILQSESLDENFMKEYQQYEIDIAIVFAFGSIISEEIINIPTLGTYNIHLSLLPQFRGASPVAGALLNNLETTGTTIQKMIYRLDAGPIAKQASLEIEENDNRATLTEKLIELSKSLLIELLQDLEQNNLSLTEQNEQEKIYFGKIDKAQTELLSSHTDQEKWNMYRAYTPYPSVWYRDEKGKRVKITKAEFFEGKFRPLRIIPEGKKEQDFQ